MKFIPGSSYIPASGKVFDNAEIRNIIKAAKNGWWTEGEFAKKFEELFSSYQGVRFVTLVNSGSSANLLALSALTSAAFGKKALKPGDEVITSACAFPTTVNPIIQNRMTPVFVDVELGTKNPSVSTISRAITKKTRAIMLAHTLGNPLPLDGIMELVKKNGLWFIEDCCDGLGSVYNKRLIGTFGHVATYSFYPAHHITMGEGGALVTDNYLIHKAIRQFRDWGRDCWCDTGKDNTCKKRFAQQIGNLPYGFDHKYTYSQVGYNLKLTDFQAAIGVAQMKKLPDFIKRRKVNFKNLYQFFKKYKKYFILPEWEKQSDPSWFGFILIIKDSAPFTKLDLINYLEDNKIDTRSLFAGNLLKHPAYTGRYDLKVVGQLVNSDIIMNRGFWIGVYPGITDRMIGYVESVMETYLRTFNA
jgi:CDP-6-deoxy-D-xylo-4-hexulose-3-dehydrase